MTDHIVAAKLHRTAKLFMDNGRACSHEDAMNLLASFGLVIEVGEEIARSAAHQTALLTLVNTARRTLLGGVEVVGLTDAPCLSPLMPRRSLVEAVTELQGVHVVTATPGKPMAIIGSGVGRVSASAVWQVTWEGWRGGVVPESYGRRLSEDNFNPLAPILAASVCASEVFSFLSGDHPLAGLQSVGLSLWRPGSDWLAGGDGEAPIDFLPDSLWILGLGNLGQAFATCLASLPYPVPSGVRVVLQDNDRIALSNDSTSLLSFARDVGRRKTRAVAEWLEARGFECFLEERRFGKHTARAESEPSVMLCGVDNALARAELDPANFELILEAGLGAGPEAFRSIAVHAFPASRTPAEVWSAQVGQAGINYENRPAYAVLRKEGFDKCGLTQLASRTVGAPFVGLIAACLVFSELLRRLNGGPQSEVISTSALALEDVALVTVPQRPYASGYLVTRTQTSSEFVGLRVDSGSSMGGANPSLEQMRL